MRRAAQTVGGNAMLFIAATERAAGERALFDQLKPPLDRLHVKLKQQFDPSGIFNPGRFYPEL
jgi:glycolate oxidase FAD binding subunit